MKFTEARGTPNLLKNGKDVGMIKHLPGLKNDLRTFKFIEVHCFLDGNGWKW